MMQNGCVRENLSTLLRVTGSDFYLEGQICGDHLFILTGKGVLKQSISCIFITTQTYTVIGEYLTSPKMMNHNEI